MDFNELIKQCLDGVESMYNADRLYNVFQSIPEYSRVFQSIPEYSRVF